MLWPRRLDGTHPANKDKVPPHKSAHSATRATLCESPGPIRVCSGGIVAP